jgi:outer membrane protein OmpA-like peptidoglycan-associated protein
MNNQVLKSLAANFRNFSALTGLGLALLVPAGCGMMKPRPQMQSQSQEAPTFIAFFRPDSAELTPLARSIVDQAAQKARELKPSTIALTGYAFNLGDPEQNKRMSEQRIVVVQQALISDGIDPKLFLRMPLGAPEDSVGPTGDRRIEIRLVLGK